jgi:hypothetical protein
MNLFEYYFNEKHKIVLKGSSIFWIRNVAAQIKLQRKKHRISKGKRKKVTKNIGDGIKHYRWRKSLIRIDEQKKRWCFELNINVVYIFSNKP